MRSNGLIFFGLALACLISCNSVKDMGSNIVISEYPDDNQNVVPLESNNIVWDYKNIRVLEDDTDISRFPLATFNLPMGASVLSMVNGQIEDGLFEVDEFNLFNDKLVLKIEEKFTLYGIEKKTNYYVMVFDYTKILAETNSVELDSLEKPASESADNTIFDIKHYLDFQKQIIEKAA